jgi:uncharacterized protein YfbU (UPF0304 family)
MRLSRTERWILANQYRILERLYPEEADSLAETREALEEGFELHYPPEGIYADKDIVTEDECREVLDILDMYRAFTSAYDGLKDKKGIDKTLIKFRGFDGNNETKQMAYARYFCNLDNGRYQELGLAKSDFNSHFPVLGRYRAMLAEWNTSAKKHELTKDDIIRIISAK